VESGSEGKKRKMTSGIFLKTAAVVLACVGGGVDLKTHKIPNRLTVPGMLLGIILNFIFILLPPSPYHMYRTNATPAPNAIQHPKLKYELSFSA
jgi:prepilin signal peptidase PulO-like enzyme (type II secretory pathway)